MPTIFAVYNLKKNQNPEEYDNYLTKTKIPGIRGAPWCTEFKTWKVDKVLGPAVSEPEGTLPTQPPYSYVAKIEVSDLDAMTSFLGTDAGKEFARSWSVYMDPTSIFTLGHEVQQYIQQSPQERAALEASFEKMFADLERQEVMAGWEAVMPASPMLRKQRTTDTFQLQGGRSLDVETQPSATSCSSEMGIVGIQQHSLIKTVAYTVERVSETLVRLHDDRDAELRPVLAPKAAGDLLMAVGLVKEEDGADSKLPVSHGISMVLSKLRIGLR